MKLLPWPRTHTCQPKRPMSILVYVYKTRPSCLQHFHIATKWQGSTIQMEFQVGNAFKDDSLVEAELVVTSRQGSLWMSRKFMVSVYFSQPNLAPNITKPLDSQSFPRRANVEFGLNVTRAVKVWSIKTAKTYTLQV